MYGAKGWGEFFPLVVKYYHLDTFLGTKFGPNLCQCKTISSQAAVLQLKRSQGGVYTALQLSV
jgi:hypothetical protein